MKSLVHVFTILTLTLSFLSSKSNVQFECSLAVEFFPLEYTIVTRSLSTRIRFSSNCMRMRDFTLEAFFSFKRRIQKKHHPQMIKLSIYKNIYTINYGNMNVIENGSIMQRLQYGSAVIAPGQFGTPITVDILQDNRIILMERVQNSYNLSNLKKILKKKNPRICKISKDLKTLSCKI